MRRLSAIPFCAAALLLAGQSEPASQPASNLDYWLNRAEPAATRPASQPAADDPHAGANPFGRGEWTHPDAVPGVLVLSDGTRLAGGVHTTLGRPLELYVEAENRWRRIPLIAVLSITADVLEERMELKWRWKAMGEPEKVYTGESYPYRRLQWRVKLIDGSTIIGVIKGKPVWVEQEGRKHGPYVLHERCKGEVGRKLADLVYVKQIFISRKLAEAILRQQQDAKQVSK